MVNITRVYTKTGDKGTTGLSHNIRLSKSSARIVAIGEIDQFNAFLGFAIAACNKKTKLNEIKKKMLRVQNEVFDYGALLAETQEAKLKKMVKYFPGYTERLEKEMDQMNKKISPLKSFILPGGNEIAARLHLARTSCRIAEQAIVELHELEIMPEAMLAYINRLGDWLFVISRFITDQLGEKEILWKPFYSG